MILLKKRHIDILCSEVIPLKPCLVRSYLSWCLSAATGVDKVLSYVGWRCWGINFRHAISQNPTLLYFVPVSQYVTARWLKERDLIGEPCPCWTIERTLNDERVHLFMMMLSGKWECGDSGGVMRHQKSKAHTDTYASVWNVADPRSRFSGMSDIV